MRSNLSALMAVLLSLAAASAPAPAATPSIHDLGTLGGTRCFGTAVNDAGQVAGWSTLTGDTATHAFRYDGTPGSGGVMLDLGTLGGTTSVGHGINDVGHVVGSSALAGDATGHAQGSDPRVKQKRPVGSLPPSKPPAARHRPGARSARQGGRHHPIADHTGGSASLIERNES